VNMSLYGGIVLILNLMVFNYLYLRTTLG
jgi:hypothetical protein